AIKGAGFRTRFLLGYEVATTRMYDSLRQAFRGWARIYATTNELSPWHILLAIGFLIINGLGGWAALLWGIHAASHFGQWQWVVGAALHAALTVVYLIPVYRWSGNPRWCAMFFPITTVAMFVILFDALNLCRTGKITWRGTSYSFRSRAAES